MFKRQPILAAALAAAMAGALGGCATSVAAGSYPRSQVGQVNRVDEGIILSARPVQIEGNERAAVGTTTGAVLGGIAGSEIGGGEKANAAGAVAGAVIGGLAGNAIEKGVTSRRGFAYTVRKNDGTLVTITQGADIAMQPGQRVFIEYGARARVIPAG
jgi:outer membrane lipoprotein SlyB